VYFNNITINLCSHPGSYMASSWLPGMQKQKIHQCGGGGDNNEKSIVRTINNAL